MEGTGWLLVSCVVRVRNRTGSCEPYKGFKKTLGKCRALKVSRLWGAARSRFQVGEDIGKKQSVMGTMLCHLLVTANA